VKKIILLILPFSVVFVSAQPRLVTALRSNGPKQGGSLFRADLPAGTPGVLHVFDNLMPHAPTGGVCAGDDDWLYGVLFFNGTDNKGALYRIKKDGSGFSVLYSMPDYAYAAPIPYYHTDGNIYFTAGTEIKKYDPATGTITGFDPGGYITTKNFTIDANDWIYYYSQFPSTISKIKTDGTEPTVVYSFNATDGNDGSLGVTEVGDKLFGVMRYGGSSDGGIIYSMQKDGTGFTIHRQLNAATGMIPESKLIYFDGKLYGTSSQGGNAGRGSLFVIDTSGANFRVLTHFNTALGFASPPSGNISISSNGRIFGSFQQFYTTNNAYRLFKIDTSGAAFEPFFVVNQREHGHSNKDVLLLNDETIFIATSEMGRHDGGALNQCDTSGSGINLFHFGYAANGFRPTGGLIKSTNGKLYGNALIGSTTGNGIVYSINQDGSAYTKLHEFTDTEGYELSGKLLEASDGKLYGACRYGGPANTGCIFRMDKSGANFQVLYSFTDFSKGYWPNGNLVEDNTGALYGTTYASSPGWSTVFKINKDGSNYTRLKLFDNTEIHYPDDGLTLSGSYLYGSCTYGGAENKGGVFRIHTDGTGYEVLHEFAGTADGAQPMTTPIIATNGKLYGTTVNGGASGYGIIYSMDITGSNYTTLKTFTDGSDGSYPQTGIMQASDGALYGATLLNSTGGAGGVLYKISLDGSGFTPVKTFNTDIEGQGASIPLDLNGAAPLPVHWLVFTAQPVNKTVLLQWQTAQEQNSKNFEIERSSNGSNFSYIGAIAAAGNSGVAKNYSFTDGLPLKGNSYYRLRQTDLDGKFTYSKVVSINFSNRPGFSLYPNPVHDILYINTTATETILSVTITDMNGRLLQHVRPGRTSFLSIPVSNLSAGIFQVRVKTTQNIYTKKITRQ
jgi:uncharacterized repeat protein (TIGR03803 family)